MAKDRTRAEELADNARELAEEARERAREERYAEEEGYALGNGCHGDVERGRIRAEPPGHDADEEPAERRVSDDLEDRVERD